MYWHMYASYDEGTDLLTNMLAGPVKVGPDESAEPGRPSMREMTFSVEDMLSSEGVPPDNLPSIEPLSWVASWDHMPTQLELDEFRPEGHRSTDSDDDDDDDD